MDNFDNTNLHEEPTGAPSSSTPPYTPPQSPYMPPRTIQQPQAFHWYDWLISLLCLPLSYGIISGFFEGNWVFTCSYCVLFIAASAYLITKHRRVPADAVLLGAFALATSLSFALHGDVSASGVAFFLLIPLSGIYCVLLTNENRYPLGSAMFIFDVLRCEVGQPIAEFFHPWRAALHTRPSRTREPKVPKEKKSGDHTKNIIFAVLGAVVGLLILSIVIVPLLVKSDAAFAAVLGTAFQKFFGFLWEGIKRLFENLYLPYIIGTLIVSPFIVAVLFRFRHNAQPVAQKQMESGKRGRMPGAFFITFLSVILVVYLVFLVSQGAYFFSGFAGTLPHSSSYTLAQYARRGFFEMVEIAGINLVLIAVTAVFCKRSDEKIPAAVKALSAVSISKIVLYIHGMGLTEKRLWVLAADLVLLLSFAAVLIRLFVKKFPYFKVMLYATCLAVAVISLMGTNRLIATFNTNAYLNGTIKDPDLEQMESLDFDGYLAMKKIASSDKPLAKVAAQEAANYEAMMFRGERGYMTANWDEHRFFSAREKYLMENENAALDKYHAYFMLNDTNGNVQSVAVTFCNQTVAVEHANHSPLQDGKLYVFSFDVKEVRAHLKSVDDIRYQYTVTMTDGSTKEYDDISNCVLFSLEQPEGLWAKYIAREKAKFVESGYNYFATKQEANAWLSK